MTPQQAVDILTNMRNLEGFPYKHNHDIMQALNIVVEALGVQPVVRCGKCKYGAPNGVYGCRLERFSYLDDSVRMYGEDFCSKGKRKGADNVSD